MSVAFSADNRQIVSGSRDKTIKLWNTLAQCKYTIQEEGHGDWVSCVNFSPNNANPIIVSCGRDKYVKVWNLTNCKLKGAAAARRTPDGHGREGGGPTAAGHDGPADPDAVLPPRQHVRPHGGDQLPNF